MTFSIIVPVYNVENYLRKCLDSLVNQTFHEYEIIIVDDGSKDSSGKICEEYAEKYDSIKVIHKPNEGLAATWMREGLNAVQGEYVGSIDSDDWVDNDLLEKLNTEIKTSNPDILVYGYKNVCNGVETINRIVAREGLYDKAQIETEILPYLINCGGFRERNCFYLSRINKFVKRDLLLKNIKFYNPNISFGEDNYWTIPNVLSAKSIYVFAKWYPYSYRVNMSSVSRSYHEGLWEKFNELANNEVTILEAFDKNWMINQVYNDMVMHAAICINNIMKGNFPRSVSIEEIKKIRLFLTKSLIIAVMPYSQLNRKSCNNSLRR